LFELLSLCEIKETQKHELKLKIVPKVTRELNKELEIEKQIYTGIEKEFIPMQQSFYA
jgi:hypothetical protein